jgi:hypothetical protein
MAFRGGGFPCAPSLICSSHLQVLTVLTSLFASNCTKQWWLSWPDPNLWKAELFQIVQPQINHHYHKHPVLCHLARPVSRVTVALSIVSSVSQFFSFLVGCSDMILKGFGFVAFFTGVEASSFCIHLSCLVCCLSVVRGEWSRLFCGHRGRNLPEVSIISFLPPQINKVSNYQNLLRGSQGIPNQFPEDPWIHFCNGYFQA